MREHLRAVIWPRQTEEAPSQTKDKDGKTVYRYAIVGVLVTDRPLDLGPSASRGARCPKCYEWLTLTEKKVFKCPDGCTLSKAAQKAAAESSKAGPTEYLVDGSAGGLGYTLEVLPKFRPLYPLGDAGDVLTGLDRIVGDKVK